MKTIPFNTRRPSLIATRRSGFSGRDAFGPISESTPTSIRAGLDELPDVTLAASWKGGKAFVKLATVVRKFGSPTSNDTATG